ncbi:MAG: DNA ligase, partial [Clostridia bacterium]|nr:DNA ligase [Clostridia bacterium]
GHVTLGVSRAAAERFPTAPHCPFAAVPPGDESALWYREPPVCTVTYMERTSSGGMRQPRFKGFREDVPR